VFIINEKEQLVHMYLSTPDGKPLAALHLDINNSDTIRNVAEYWCMQQVYCTHWDREQFTAWVQSLIGQRQITEATTYQAGDEPPESLTLQFVPFVQGMLYVGSAQPLTDTQIELVQALAEAFAVAYARYEDFSNLEAALSELKSTQAQLIQKEKMASLGELTAGIAHEIQNPLNFVNNFSEINTELIDELKNELVADNKEEALLIAEGIKENEQKIIHHGKRADSIVKGMLQHSRASTGKKELTEINALVDECVRLSYHGMRAKDKEFNAAIKTDFDESIGRINIVPQDISRVLLNLLNNAFYAVDEKKRQLNGMFEPVVSVYTKKLDGKVEIVVKDNGNGIPQNVIDKIFQPFFTTKPTGQGTGLGLSLSYDIIKAHGGEIQVESNEGEETEFTIQLPA
jgi:signal transduction histidine kinase